MKIVLASDNHGLLNVIKTILFKHQDGDYYLHCGDSELNKELLRPFVSVKGNNDFAFDFPMYHTLVIERHNVLLIHGHGYIYLDNYEGLVKKAKELSCDVVLFGHSHMYFDGIIDGIRLINPGSCWCNRDHTKPSYAIVEIKKDEIIAKRYDLDCNF